ncbi:hypothetical protein MD484_g8697, partial [Candolleomyces efflorescens]
MFAESDDPQAQLEAIAYATLSSNLFWVAMTTAVLYDHVSTFDLEVELVWKKRWSFIKLLYLIVSFLPLLRRFHRLCVPLCSHRIVTYRTPLFSMALPVIFFPRNPVLTTQRMRIQLSFGFLMKSSVNCTLTFHIPSVWTPNWPEFNQHCVSRCPSFTRVQTWTSIIALIAMQGIMVHRVICMYNYNRKIIVCLLSGYAVLLTGCIIFAGLLMRVESTPLFLPVALRLCVPLSIPSYNVANWFIMMTFDLTIVILAISEALRYARESRNMHGSAGLFAGTRFAKQGTMIRILLRDSIVFPIIGLLICVFNILANYVLVSAAGYMLVITAAASPILGCRLILHLRDAYYQPFKSEFDRHDCGDAQIEMPSFALHSTTHSSIKRSSRTSEEAVS